MNSPESFPPRGGAVASGQDPMSAPFTGQKRDFLAPFEFPPVTAVQLLASGLVARVSLPESSKALVIQPLEQIEPVPEASQRRMVPAETAISLQALTRALTGPSVLPVTAAVVAAENEFSLTALANQLQTRFTEADSTADLGADLLSNPAAFTPVALVASSPVSSPVIVPLENESLVALTAFSPKLGQPLVPFAATLDLLESLPPQPLPKPAISRQGDVFFTALPAVLPASEEPSALDEASSIEAFLPPLSNKYAMISRDRTTPSVSLFDHSPLAKGLAEPILPPPPLSVEISAFSATQRGSGLGLILGGVALMVLGIYFACLLPTFWLALEGAEEWSRQKIFSALVLYGAAALGALTLGVGSLRSRRWAPPLIHAAGWVIVLTVSGIIAVIGFHLVTAEADTPVPHSVFLLQLLAALLLPLGSIFYYQQESTTAFCEMTDPEPSWTDHLPVPALMVFLTGLILTIGAAAVLCHRPAFSLAYQSLLTGPGATLGWVVLGVFGLASAVCVRLRKAVALWFLMLAALLIAVALSPVALTAGPHWESLLSALGRPAAAGPFDPLVPLLIALIPAPLFLIFAMARRSFLSLPPP